MATVLKLQEIFPLFPEINTEVQFLNRTFVFSKNYSWIYEENQDLDLPNNYVKTIHSVQNVFFKKTDFDWAFIESLL
jgi:hypothetical protein